MALDGGGAGQEARLHDGANLSSTIFNPVFGDLDQPEAEGKPGLIAQVLADPLGPLGYAVACHDQQEAACSQIARYPVDKARLVEFASDACLLQLVL